jgi:hypothetical protein
MHTKKHQQALTEGTLKTGVVNTGVLEFTDVDLLSGCGVV